MRVQRSTAQHLVTRDSAAVETPAAAESPQDREGWPLGLNVLQKRPLPKRTHRDESERRPHQGDANARVAQAEAVYDVFVVAKYLADPLHGTADETAELINDIPPRRTRALPEAGESAHPRPITHRHRMATTCHPHRMPHIPHSRTLHMARMRRRLRGTMGRMPAPGIRRIRMRLGMQRRTASLHALAEEGAPAGAFDLAMSLSISGAMLPLSSLAIYAAYKETREVAEQRTHLRQQERRLRSEQARLQSGLDTTAPAGAADAYGHALSEAIDTNAYLQRRNVRDGVIAATSMASAGVIFTKAASELGIQGGLAIASKSANAAGLVGHSAAAAGAASAACIAGSFVLAPLASVAATALGGAFLHQSRRERTHVAVDVGRVQRFLQDLEPGELSPWRTALPALCEHQVGRVRPLCASVQPVEQGLCSGWNHLHRQYVDQGRRQRGRRCRRRGGRTGGHRPDYRRRSAWCGHDGGRQPSVPCWRTASRSAIARTRPRTCPASIARYWRWRISCLHPRRRVPHPGERPTSPTNCSQPRWTLH